MKIYFPQWQGSGNGTRIESGAKAVLGFLNDADFVAVPLSTINAGEQGEKRFDINNYDALFEQLARLKCQIENNEPETLQTIGGDCGLEIVPCSYLNHKYENFGIIWFDAHADINKPCDSASCNFHGMPLRTLLGEGEHRMNPLLFSTIEPSQIHYVGLRDIDAAEQVRIEEGGIYAPKKIDIPDLVNVLKAKKMQNLYLHFDFDCLEPKEYDKTYFPTPKGVTIKEAEDCIKTLQQNFKVVGSSVLESTAINSDGLTPIASIIKALMK